MKSVFASSTIHTHIWENPWGGGNLETQRDEKRSIIRKEKPLWYYPILFLMWLGCHGFPNEKDPMMFSSSMLNMDACMMPIIFPISLANRGRRLTKQTKVCMYVCLGNCLTNKHSPHRHRIHHQQKCNVYCPIIKNYSKICIYMVVHVNMVIFQWHFLLPSLQVMSWMVEIRMTFMPISGQSLMYHAFQHLWTAILSLQFGWTIT